MLSFGESASHKEFHFVIKVDIRFHQRDAFHDHLIFCQTGKQVVIQKGKRSVDNLAFNILEAILVFQDFIKNREEVLKSLRKDELLDPGDLLLSLNRCRLHQVLDNVQLVEQEEGIMDRKDLIHVQIFIIYSKNLLLDLLRDGQSFQKVEGDRGQLLGLKKPE